jgi:isochorismate pyruvate lyase
MVGMNDDTLADLRKEIDDIDAALVDLLARRFAVVDRVIGVKLREGLPALLPERVEVVVARVRTLAVAAGIPADAAEAVWRALINQTIAYEEAVLGTAAERNP